jgi:myo-inositol-1(or 4)-monophosphatase
MQPTLNDLQDFARQAGELLCGGYGRSHAALHKGRIDLVTEYDKRSEELLLGLVRRRFPGHTILSEESGRHVGGDEHLWIIDPLDGTTNFAHGLPIFGVSIAYADAQGVRLGVVYDPTRDEMFAAERGAGAWLNGERLQVSQTDELLQSLLTTGFAYENWVIEANLPHFNHFQRLTQGVRRLGSAALDLCCVAAGRVDGYWETQVQPWDLAAGGLIAAEAGALVTNLRGGPDYLTPTCSVLAANPTLHARMLTEISTSSIKGNTP